MAIPRTAPRFTVGQTVIFINDSGVNWGEKVITEWQWDDIRGNIYHYAHTDTPWFMTSERHLHAPSDVASIVEATRVHVASCGRC